MRIRSEEMSKSIPMYLVPKPFDQTRPGKLLDSKGAVGITAASEGRHAP